MRVICSLPMVLALACGGPDPLSYSAPVGINLKAKGDEPKSSGALSDEKNIATESGNPYGQFVQGAQQKLNGKSPSRIEVSKATLLLGGTSKGVTNLEQVMAGRAEILFVMDDTNNSFPVAHLVDPKGSGPLNFDLDFDPATVKGADFTKLLGGTFKVVLRSPSAASFTGKDQEADLQVTFEFAAFE